MRLTPSTVRATPRNTLILFGIRPLDPLALGAAVAFLVTLTVPAAYLPARRAVEADPLQALRHV